VIDLKEEVLLRIADSSFSRLNSCCYTFNLARQFQPLLWMFKNPFSFEGRIRRLEYGLSYLIYIAIMIVLSLLAEVIGDTAALLLLLFAYIPLLWFLIAQGAKRCHDRDNTGFFQLIPFYAFWMLLAPGDSQANRFGSDPKGHLDGYGNE
jgi:uncharacterized membrane protein YhaH (DUF805 family)